ncbi:MAG: hypothetical protein RQ757_09050 [Pseudomonadales bacterium]|nr:hypothetical protein [Pseudomonadales bacterium]
MYKLFFLLDKAVQRQVRLSDLLLYWLLCGLLCGLLLLTAGRLSAQDLSGLDELALPPIPEQPCFGLLGITESRALSICDALYLRENVRARELAQRWLNQEPDSPAAQFAMAEVLAQVEGNLPRALFHLKQTETLTNYSSLGRALADGNMEWHYLALTQLSYIHQLMGDQEASLLYLDKIRDIYGQDTESFRGWPLIKLKRYDEARASAEKVLSSTDNPNERSRAWNTLCAVELADLRPDESLLACERAISEDENFAISEASSVDTVHLLNASEVSLSLLRMEEAESYLRQAVRGVNPDSVGNPWINLLYLTMSQARLDEARSALDNMMFWRNAQSPLVNVMNRAEHYMVSGMFLLLAGYGEDAARLSAAALSQPDRTGSYTADESQKDSIAALLDSTANRLALALKQEEIAATPWFATIPLRAQSWALQFKAWRSARHAASLFADRETLKNRLRPYAPLDVHIPEWMELELVDIMGPGIIAAALDEARAEGMFSLNEGYYFSYRTGIAWSRRQTAEVLRYGQQALELLPEREMLLRTRVSAYMADAAWRQDDFSTALSLYSEVLQNDPGLPRRLGLALPVDFRFVDTAQAAELSSYLAASPRFRRHPNGFLLEITATDGFQACLRQRNEAEIACQQLEIPETDESRSPAQLLAAQFQRRLFTPGYVLDPAQRLALLGSSVILTRQNNPGSQQDQNAIRQR